ncbi:MAG: guanylate kinase [Oscillospiraceae bacterium]|nr:guanylate kinase [Oscillospiraceae bacterium]
MSEIGKNLVVISGPSGCGKDTVVKHILKTDDRFVLSVSATTRPKRPTETDGVDYIFLTAPEFIARIAGGEFLEHTLYCDNYYGTLKSQIEQKVAEGKVVILVIEVEGAANVKKVYPDALTIFVAPPSLEELERRLRNRGTEGDDVIKQRLFKASEELGFQSSYDYIVENNFVEQCAQSIINIYENEK